MYKKTTKNSRSKNTTHEAFFKEKLKGIAFLGSENGDVETHSSHGGGGEGPRRRNVKETPGGSQKSPFKQKAQMA